MNNKYYTICGITEIGGKIPLVRHTYGAAKDRILLPGGFVSEGEPKSDGHENIEVLLLTAEEALARIDLTNLSRELITAYMKRGAALGKSEYVLALSDSENYSLYEG